MSYPALTQERRNVLTRFAFFCNSIEMYRFKVPASVISELEAFRLPLISAKSDPSLRDEAVLYLENLDLVLGYCKALNSGKRAEAMRLKAEADRKAAQLNELVIQKIERRERVGV